MRGNPASDFFPAMDRATIPQQDNGAPQMPEQVLQECADIHPSEIPAAQSKIKRHSSPFG